MSTPEPGRFADQWIYAWNARDVEAVLTHYADDVVFTSPTAKRVVPESGGTVRGKDALRSYWRLALLGNPNLRFEPVGVYAGVNTIVLHLPESAGRLGQRGAVLSGRARHGRTRNPPLR